MPAMPKPLLPLFLDLDGRHALVLGHGEAAERRAATLCACGALVRQSPDTFAPSMLDGCTIAVGAEAPDEALLAMTSEARRRGIPFNVVDRPGLSGYATPAVVSRAPLQIAISSGGAAPVLARLLRRFRLGLIGAPEVSPRGLITTQPDRRVPFLLTQR